MRFPVSAALIAVLLVVACSGALCEGSYSIVLPDSPSRTVKHAADELAKYVHEMTGAPVAVGTKADGGETAVFVLGSAGSNATAKSLLDAGKLTEPEGWSAEADEDAFYLKSAGKHIVLAGKSDAAVLYAVYEYLQRYGDCGFFEDGDYVPSLTPRIAGVDYFSKPRFTFRHFRGDLCGAWGIKKFHFFHRDMGDWTGFYDWLAKRRINRSDFWPLINSEMGGDAIEMAFGIKDEEPGERYGWGWPTGYSWPSKVRTRLLQRRLSYQRDLGIKAVIQVLFGVTPVPFKKAHPELKWVNGGYDHAMISPDEPKGYELSKKFLQAVVDLYGTDHLYQDTPYSESLAASNYDETLRLKIAAAKADCKIFKEIDPQATWITDSWDFVALGNFWTAERRKTYFESIPREMCYFADATTDMASQYAKSNYFGGLPWAIGNLHSYQGDDHLHGSLQGEIDWANAAVNDPKSDKLTGFFHLPEIHGHDIMYWQLSTELAWNPKGVTLDGFVSDYTLRRYGRASYSKMLAAQKLIVKGVYCNNGQIPIYKKIGSGCGFYVACTPIWEDNYKGGEAYIAGLPNTVGSLDKGIGIALTQDSLQKSNQLYENDIVEWTKSYLGHAFNYAVVRSYLAFKSGDKAELDKQSEYAMRSLRLIQDILSTRPDYWLATTVDAAMAVPGTNPAADKMIRKNCVNDQYAANDCYEQTYQFYLPRAEVYFIGLKERLAKGEKTMRWADVAPAGDKFLTKWLEGPVDVPAGVAFKGTPIEACHHAIESTRDIARDIERYGQALKQKKVK